MTGANANGARKRRRVAGFPAYLQAMRRGARLVLGLALVAAAAVYGITVAAPAQYESTAKIAKQGAGLSAGTTDVRALQRDLATSRTLITTRGVVTAAATQIPGETARSVKDGLRATVDPEANIIRITVRGEKRSQVTKIATVVTDTFLAVRTGVLRAQVRATSATLRRQVRAAAGDPAQARSVAALRDRLAELAVGDATAGADLFVVEPASAASAAPSHSIRNAAIACVLALLLGLIALWARERSRPHTHSARQLGALLMLPVLAEVAHNPRRRVRGAPAVDRGEYEGYHVLRAALEIRGPTGKPVTVVVSSADRGDGKTTVTANLGRALAQAGYRVLLIAGDTREPTLQTAFGVDGATGISDVLRRLRIGPHRGAALADTIVGVPPAHIDELGSLSVVPPGSPLPDPGPLFTPATAQALLAQIGALPYDYVVIDTPHLTRFVDGQILAAAADAVVIVARLGQASLEALRRLRAILDLLALSPLGLVVIGTRDDGPQATSPVPSDAPPAPTEDVDEQPTAKLASD